MLTEENRAALHTFFIRIGRRMGRGIRELGVSPAEARVLRTLDLHGGEEGMNPSAISEALGVQQPTLTPVYNSLEEKGFIERTRAEGDRRKVRVRLTDKWRTLFSEHVGPRHGGHHGRRLMESIEECLTPEECEQLLAILQKIEAHIHRDGHEHGEECPCHAHHSEGH